MPTIKMSLLVHIKARKRKIKTNSAIDNIIQHLNSIGYNNVDIWVTCNPNSDNKDFKITKMGANAYMLYYHFNKKEWINEITPKKPKNIRRKNTSKSLTEYHKSNHIAEQKDIIDNLQNDGLSPQDYILDYPGGKWRNWKIEIVNITNSPYKCICGEKGKYYSRQTKKWRCSKTSGGCKYIQYLQTAWKPITQDNNICNYGCGSVALYRLNEKYCCSNNPQKCIAVIEKIIEKNRSWKNFIFPSGNLIRIQGYEDVVLHELLSYGYSEEELFAGKGNVPIIKYTDSANKQRRHFPDIFIPHENRIIEVKSDFTYKIDEKNNILKQNAALSLGYKYDIIIKTKSQVKKHRNKKLLTM